MRRFRIFTLLALVAMVALVATGCGGKKKAATSGQSAEQSVNTALANVTKIKSGVITLDATFSGGGMPGSFTFKGVGAFDTQASGGPAFKLDMTMDIAGNQQKFGFTTVGGQGYMQFGNSAFALGKTGGGSSQATGAINPAQLQQLINSLEGNLSDIKQVGTIQADGRTLTVYSAKVDLAKVATSAQRKTGALPNVPGLGNVKGLAGSLGVTTVRIGVGDDQLPRSVVVDSSYAKTGNGTAASGGIKLNALVTKVNEPVSIKKPANVSQSQDALKALGGMFGGAGAAPGATPGATP